MKATGRSGHEVLTNPARHKPPAIHEYHEFTLASSLMSYGTHLGEMYRQIGVYTGRILKGVKPADLPVLQPTRFDPYRTGVNALPLARR